MQDVYHQPHQEPSLSKGLFLRTSGKHPRTPERGVGVNPSTHRLHCSSFWWFIRLMDKILHDPKDPKLWELWYIPYNG